MPIRSDLAIDLLDVSKECEEGIKKSICEIGDVKFSTIKVESEKAEEILKKPKGEYITLEFPSVEKITDYSNLKKAVKKSLNRFIPEKWESIMIVGLGNTDITPDNIGPEVISKILATRHITGQFAENIGLKGLRSVSVIAPGVLGKTGIEASEITEAIVKKVNPTAIIVIDALASKSVSRLFKTIQLCNTGISPGSGVKNSRSELSEKVLGKPVIAIGVPTVVDANTLAYELTGKEPQDNISMIVTPKDADLLCNRVSEIISQCLNVYLQPDIDEDIILSLV